MMQNEAKELETNAAVSGRVDLLVMCAARIEDGWQFLTADFSMIAAGRNKPGYVTFIRCREDVDNWHMMPDELKEDENGPPLYVTGRGMTFEEAIIDANMAAAHAKPIST